MVVAARSGGRAYFPLAVRRTGTLPRHILKGNAVNFARFVVALLLSLGMLFGVATPASSAEAPASNLRETSAMALYVPCNFYNHSSLGVRSRINRVLNGVSESQIVTVMPGEDVTGQDGWRWSRSSIADNHYAQINVVSAVDGKSRWYNIWGPYTFTAENKKKVILAAYRYSSSPKHGVIEQVL
jgi:hypothetical protein